MAEKTYTVERSTTIQAAPQRVYDQIADFRKWTAWSPWEDVDPQLQRTYSGAASGTGAVYAWKGNRKAGQGTMKVAQATAPTRVQIDLTFEKPWKARNDMAVTIEPQGSGSRVTWSMTGSQTLAVRAMGLVTSMDTLIGKDFEKGLARLKAIAEAPDPASGT